MSKRIIVTGASRGIGFETVKYLAGQKCNVIAVARSGDRLADLKKVHPEQIVTIALDLTEHKSIQMIKKLLEENRFMLDGIIHNAGLLINKPFLELTDEDWYRQMEVNLMVPVRMTRELLRFFNKKSHILNIGSMGGFQGSSKFPGLSAYSAAKGAVSVLTECLAMELSNYKISSNCFCLGAVQTEMLQQAFPGFKAPVDPDSIGRLIGDFVLNGHQFYNGQLLPVTVGNPG